MQGCVRVENMQTEWFTIASGIRQGDIIAPTMFSLFVNDLAMDIKALHKGIYLDDEELSILMFADDIVLLSETEEGLQRMLDALSEWCEKYRLFVNITKTHVMHFRQKSQTETSTQFTYRNANLENVSYVPYLGMEFTYNMDLSGTANNLAEAGSRALGELIAKYYRLKGMSFDVYEHIYNTCVIPVLDYSSEVWGARHYPKTETVHNRAIKLYMGVGKTCPTPTIIGDSGWYPSHIRRKQKMIKLWNKLVQTNDNRLLKKVFLYDWKMANSDTDSWCKDMKLILQENNMLHLYQEKAIVCETEFENNVKTSYTEKWKQEMNAMSKLEEYAKFTTEIKAKDYLTATFLNKKQRSALAHAISGTLPIEIETGRWRRKERHDRICRQCNDNVIEDLTHFLTMCEKHKEHRDTLYSNIENITNIKINL